MVRETLQGRLRRAVSCLAVVLWVGACGSTQAAPFEVPALVSPPNSSHDVGKLVWLDLETTDLPGAKRFYGGLFGWTFRDYHADGLDYTVALVGAQPVAGFVRRPVLNDTERASRWLPFFSVADVDETFRHALGAGATVRSTPENLPLRGRQARLTDPQGAVFALEHSTSGDPPDDPNPRAIGSWGVPELLARDPADEAVFYQGVLGLSILAAPADGGFERIKLSSGPRTRASVRTWPSGKALSRAEWIGVARVFSVADTVGKAVRLGGRMLAGPAREAQGATGALLEDPTGAAFGVSELPPEMVDLRAP